MSIVPVNDYVTIHPALDFYDGKVIVAVGGKWQYNYDDGSVEFDNKPFCVISDGDKFGCNKRELATRHLFHSGYLDIPVARWNFEDIEKFSREPESLTFPEIHQQIYKTFAYYMDFPDERIYSLLSCFTIYTYFYPLFNSAPVLQLWGEFRTGKTKVCSLLEAMAFNPINSANISSASVFRLIESRRATILLDESEDLMTTERAKDIRNMLLAGTGKSGETFRQERDTKESFHTQSYKVFSPKVIANIAGIDIPALQSRVIQITTLGTTDKTKENRDVCLEDVVWQRIRNNLYCVCLLRSGEVIEKRESLPPHEFTGRTMSIWHGMFTIAALAGEGAWSDLTGYAQDNKERIEASIEEMGEEPTLMLNKLIEMVKDKGVLYLTAEEMLMALKEFNFNSKRDLAMKLGRFGLHTKVLWLNEHYNRYYTLSKDRLQELYGQRSSK